MKNIPTSILVFLFSVSAFAQSSNVVFMSETGKRFSIVINGVQQNPKPEAHIKVTAVNQSVSSARIIFEDGRISPIDKNLLLEPGTETVFVIKANKNGEMALRFKIAIPIEEAKLLPSQHVVVYKPEPAKPTIAVPSTLNNSFPANGNNPSSNTNLPGGGNIIVNDNSGMYHNGGVTFQETYTTTTSTFAPQNPNLPPPPPVNYLPGYNGPIGCPMPMSAADFAGAKSSIASKSFEDSKLKMAKQVINSNCLLSSQVKELMKLFSFENSRLDFAKYAYGYTYDLGNYFRVNDAFQFESSVDELNEFINNR